MLTTHCLEIAGHRDVCVSGVLVAHCMEIAGHMEVYSSGALYGDCGVHRRLY